MKRYLVFACNDYYPLGGWEDFVGAFDNIEDASAAGEEACKDRWEVIDLATLSEVEDG